MSRDDHTPLLYPREFVRVHAPVPPALEEAIGYDPPDRPACGEPDSTELAEVGRAGPRYLAVWWEADGAGAWADGACRGAADPHGLAAWAGHPAVRFALHGVPAAAWLVLDRHQREAWAAPEGVALAWLVSTCPVLPADPGPAVRPQVREIARLLCVPANPAAVNAEMVRRRAAATRVRVWLDAYTPPAARARGVSPLRAALPPTPDERNP